VTRDEIIARMGGIIEDLVTEIDQLKAERDDARREKARLEGLDCLNRMQRDEVERDRDRARAALKKYGRHQDDCSCFRHESPRRCDCGLDAALEGLTDA
jgi:hypothetical protein